MLSKVAELDADNRLGARCCSMFWRPTAPPFSPFPCCHRGDTPMSEQAAEPNLTGPWTRRWKSWYPPRIS